jgi:hypothetical protein
MEYSAPPVVTRRKILIRVALAVAALAAVAACSPSIGDSCQSANDCSSNGSRLCDTAEPGGYCTIAGCTETSCPAEAVCVRFFAAAFLSTPCNPLTEDAPPGSNPPPTHDCVQGEICLSEGLCAPQTSERRFCELACNTNNDCRAGYVCRETGFAGAEAFPVPGQATPPVEKFCAPPP